jgi:uncharacterized membrane protein
MEIKKIPFHIYEKKAHMKIKQFPHPFFFIYIFCNEDDGSFEQAGSAMRQKI